MLDGLILTKNKNKGLENLFVFAAFIWFISYCLFWGISRPFVWAYKKILRILMLSYFDIRIFLERAGTYISNWWYLRRN